MPQGNPPLIGLLAGALGTVAVQVNIFVAALRNPGNGSEENALITGRWFATANTVECSGSGDINVVVIVQQGELEAKRPTDAGLYSGHVGEPKECP